MAPPIYFFPRITRAQLTAGGKLSRSILGSRKLEQTLSDVRTVEQDCSLFELAGSGPGGVSGCMLSVLPVSGEAPLRLGYHPAEQEWTEVLAGDVGLWIGVDEEYPPTPEDLRRRKFVQGYPLELAGQEWIIPVLRDPEGGTGLPRSFCYDSAGDVRPQVKAEYRELFERFGKALWLFNDPEAPTPITMDRKDATDLCLDAIGVNYRVGPWEQNLLGLVDSESWSVILMLACDWPTFRDVYLEVENKKKARRAATSGLTGSAGSPVPSVSPTISPGFPADSPDTSPATPNSTCQPLASASQVPPPSTTT